MQPDGIRDFTPNLRNPCEHLPHGKHPRAAHPDAVARLSKSHTPGVRLQRIPCERDRQVGPLAVLVDPLDDVFAPFHLHFRTYVLC